MAPNPWDVDYAIDGWDPDYATLMSPAIPEEPTLVRRADTGYSFGEKSPYAANSLAMSTYEAKAADLREQQGRASNHAMQLLQDSMNKSAEVTPTQGFAAALLAAIPTLGGYMIGKSVGSPELPAGYFEAGGTRKDIGLDKMEFGGANGALFGLAAGNKAAGGYLAGLDADQAQANSVRTKMAALEEQQANKLENQANAYELAGLNQEQLNARQQAYLDSRDTGGRERAPTDFDRMSPQQQQKYLAEKAGANADGTPVDHPFIKDRILTPSPRVFEKSASADSLPVLQERVRNLYSQAIKQVGPGFVEAYIRQGMAAFPANIQQEFSSTLDAMAMEMNKAVDPTPSDAGRLAQLKLLQGSIANGNFLDLMDFKVSSARKASLNELKPFTLGDNPNSQAVQAYNYYAQKWGLSPDGGPTGGASSGGVVPSPTATPAAGQIETRTLKNGETVKIQRQPDGTYLEVQ